MWISYTAICTLNQCWVLKGKSLVLKDPEDCFSSPCPGLGP